MFADSGHNFFRRDNINMQTEKPLTEREGEENEMLTHGTRKIDSKY